MEGLLLRATQQFLIDSQRKRLALREAGDLASLWDDGDVTAAGFLTPDA